MRRMVTFWSSKALVVHLNFGALLQQKAAGMRWAVVGPCPMMAML
jgi:hypothetical protein